MTSETISRSRKNKSRRRVFRGGLMLAHKPRQLWLRIPTSQPSIWYEYLSPSCIFMVENGHLYRVTDKLTMRRLSAYIDSREEA